MDRRSLLRLSLMSPIGAIAATPAGALPIVPKPLRTFSLDLRATLVHEAMLIFLKHYKTISAEPDRYVAYRCRYPYARLATLSEAKFRRFLLEPGTEWYGPHGSASHLDYIRGNFNILENEGRVIIHTKLPNRYPYDELEEIALAEHLHDWVQKLMT